MAVKILHKRSAVQFKSATGAQLELGELGLNYHESGPYLQCKDAAGEIVQLGGVYVGASAPSNKLKGAWWLRDSDNTLFLYDGTSWVSIAGGGGGGGGATTVLGGDGIKAVTASGAVTVSVDLATDSHGLSIVSGKLEADIATKTTLGTVKIGQGIDVDAAGEISVDLSGVDVNADLGYTPAVDKGTVTNTAGDDATLPLADSTNAGLFTAAEKAKLAGLPVTVGETPPSTPADGDLWWNSSDDSGRLYVYYDEGPSGSKQWVEASPQGETLTESDADTLYLSKVSDDTAAGAITFEKPTTHESGVNSTRFLVFPSANNFNYYGSTGSSSIHSRLTLDNSKTAITGASNKTYYTFISQPGLRQSSTITNFSGFSSQLNVPTADVDFTGETVGFYAGDSLGVKTKGSCYGFKSDIDVDGTRTYNFYAEGTAPNYFAGKSTFGKTICVGANGANDDNFPDGMSSSALRVYANASSSTDPKNAPIVVTGGKVLSSSPKHILTYLAGKTEIGGSIIAAASTGDLSFVNPSDYRLKTNIQSVTENASDKIKNLNVVSYTDRFGNLIPRGFVAHELQEECSEAVFGTKDATEAIGTLADYDGTVLETEVTEPEELEYTEETTDDEGVTTQTIRTRTWTSTGTRPVYQGVDQTKLIPLLTKALQEAMQKNEDLEARIAALEGA